MSLTDDIRRAQVRAGEDAVIKHLSEQGLIDPEPHSLTFDELRAANVRRCNKWHTQGINSWSAADWMTAITGEVGELASLVKMANRERDGMPGNKFSPTQEMLGKEAADIAIYLDLFCAAHGIDLGAAIMQKFNEVSERVGFPDRLPTEGGA